jgi:hypothetical protein
MRTRCVIAIAAAAVTLFAAPAFAGKDDDPVTALQNGGRYLPQLGEPTGAYNTTVKGGVIHHGYSSWPIDVQQGQGPSDFQMQGR